MILKCHGNSWLHEVARVASGLPTRRRDDERGMLTDGHMKSVVGLSTMAEIMGAAEGFTGRVTELIGYKCIIVVCWLLPSFLSRYDDMSVKTPQDPSPLNIHSNRSKIEVRIDECTGISVDMICITRQRP